MGFLLRIGLGFLALVISHALLLAAHTLGWSPDEQLSRLILASPTYWHVEWIRGILTALVAAVVWGVAYYFLFWRPSRAKPKEPIEASPSPRITAASLLRLSVGEDHSYYDIPKHGLYSLTRRFKLRLDNVSLDQSVSDCKVQITDIQPTSGYRLPRILRDGFKLAAGDHAFLPLASYGEARQPAISNYADTTVAIEGGDREIMAQHEKPNIVTIRATALAVC